MDQYNQNKKIAELISGEIQEILSAEERETLVNWISESEENKRLYYRLRNSYNFREWRKSVEKIDTDTCWKELYPFLTEEKRKYRSLQILKYAAVILFPLLITGVAYYLATRQKSESVQELQQSVQTIQPGTSKAVLILNDGKAVTLDAQRGLQIKEADGTNIEKTEGQLSYTPLSKRTDHTPLYNTIRIPRGGEYSLILADGTRVYLNAMSEFKYPVQFNKRARVVELTGEAYFEVTPSNIPFIVKTHDMKIKVLGTAFNVNAYKNSGKVITTLVHGKVKVEAKNTMGGNYILSPDEQAVFNADDLHWDVKKVDVNLYTGWKDGEFIFYDQRLEEIMEILSRWYSADVQYTSQSIRDLRFSGSLNKYNDLWEILEIIQSTNKVKIEINNTTILFKEV